MSRATSVAVLADDLTSAADGAGPFTGFGLTARIFLGSDVDTESTDVVAIDMDTRRLSPSAASVKTAVATRAVRNADLIFKTIDSTLRGNISSEISAAIAASGRRIAIVAPAFPAERRTTRVGIQFVGDYPVHESQFGSDRSNPVTASDLRIILGGSKLLANGLDRTAGIVIADAETDQDLDRLVAGCRDLSEVLWVGSPGLAAALARRVGAGFKTQARRQVLAANRVLIVVGSQNESSRAQLQQLESAHGRVDMGGDTAGVAEQLAGQLVASNVGLLTDNTTGSSPDTVANRLAEIVQKLAQADSFDGLIATGGATGRAILDGLHIRTLDLLSEPEPGVVATMANGRFRFPLILKAGGFGDSQTLRRLLSLLTNAAPLEHK